MMDGFKIITQNCANGAHGWDKRKMLDRVAEEEYAMVCLQDSSIREGDVETFERSLQTANRERPGVRYKIFWEHRDQEERRGLNATLVVGSAADGTTQVCHTVDMHRIVSTKTKMAPGQWVTVHNVYGHPQVGGREGGEERDMAVQEAEHLFAQVCAYDMAHPDDV